MSQLMAFNLKNWINEHRQQLKPPVGNTTIWKDTDFIVMIVGGPNARKDYHINHGEEFYYQLEGDITVKIIEDGKKRDVQVREGEVFLLPPLIPHSPQRPANTVGMVVEKQRADHELDRLRWYCEECGDVLHEASFKLKDIANEIRTSIEKFYADKTLRTCKKCNAVMEPPAQPKVA